MKVGRTKNKETRLYLYGRGFNHEHSFLRFNRFSFVSCNVLLIFGINRAIQRSVANISRDGSYVGDCEFGVIFRVGEYFGFSGVDIMNAIVMILSFSVAMILLFQMIEKREFCGLSAFLVVLNLIGSALNYLCVIGYL